jgi:hypothetical protein
MSFEELLNKLYTDGLDGPLVKPCGPTIAITGLMRYAGQIICDGWSAGAFKDQAAFKTFWTPEMLVAAKNASRQQVAEALVAWLESLGHKVNSMKELRSAMLKQSRKNASRSSIQSLATNLSRKQQQFLLFLEANPRSSLSEVARELWPGENIDIGTLRNRINGLVHAIQDMLSGTLIERVNDGGDDFLLFSYTPVTPRHN